MAERPAAKDPATYGTVKAHLYGTVTESLRNAEANAADITKFERAMAVTGVND